jgi:hypothetical protein
MLSLKRKWVWWYWLNEAGLLAVQVGPFLLEVEINALPAPATPGSRPGHRQEGLR